MSATSGPGDVGVVLNPTEFPKPLGYNPYPLILWPYVAAILFETFLYGIYTVLFSISMYTLIQRRRSLHWLLPTFTSIMFSIATADIGYTLFLLFQRLLKGAMQFHDLKPKYWLYVTNNVLADSLLLYRCYVVWGTNFRIIIGPLILFIASMICGYVFEGSSTELFVQSWIYVIMTFIFNVIVTCLTAGRIWWLSRKGKKFLERDLRKRYHIALAMILESGFLYSLYMLPEIILTSIILDAGLIQVVGIVPTLIVAQVGLGRAVNLIEAAPEKGEDAIEIVKMSFRPQTSSSDIVDAPSTIEPCPTISSKRPNQCIRCQSVILRDSWRPTTVEDQLSGQDVPENPPEDDDPEARAKPEGESASQNTEERPESRGQTEMDAMSVCLASLEAREEEQQPRCSTT